MANAARQLRDRVTELRNTSPQGTEAIAHVSHVVSAERTLWQFFPDREVWEGLRSETFWRIWEDREDREAPDIYRLLSREVEVQTAYLESLIAQLDTLAARLTAAPGRVAVLDSNVLLHFQPPEQVKWQEVVGQPQVRLVIPLRVIEELDEKKYTARDDLAGRSRDLLGRLRAQLAPTGGGPVQLNEGNSDVTIETFVDSGPRRRTLDADEEVLETCETFALGEQTVVLVTDDAGITIRAGTRGIEAVRMPPEYLRRRLTSEDH